MHGLVCMDLYVQTLCVLEFEYALASHSSFSELPVYSYIVKWAVCKWTTVFANASSTYSLRAQSPFPLLEESKAVLKAEQLRNGQTNASRRTGPKLILAVKSSLF